MKILYAIQGTGNGHVSRAREIIPHLKKYGETDILVSGTQADVGLEDEVKYQLHGFGFVFGVNGGVDFKKSFQGMKSEQFLKDVRKLPVKDYDLVINDFEPVCSLACRLAGKKSVGLSHQSAYLSAKTPQLKGFHWGRYILKNYAPASTYVAFHFKKYDDFIRTPVIRSEIRQLQTADLGHYTVYLPAYSDEFIINQIEKITNTEWHIFSKHSKTKYTVGNAKIFPVNNSEFQDSLAKCTGLLTGGGFEGPAEALFLGKKILAVPMANQYEQQCNALALEEMGIPVIWRTEEFGEKLKIWVKEGSAITVNYPDETEQIIKNIIENSGAQY